jgi:hypothetical protein
MKIQSLDLIDKEISILFEETWFQEDITTLQQMLFNNIPNHIIKEKTVGADRENIRFLWLDNAELMLNFDYYSQSCWFSPQDEISSKQIQPLYNLLTNNTLIKS